jgi:hypothetical protein
MSEIIPLLESQKAPFCYRWLTLLLQQYMSDAEIKILALVVAGIFLFLYLRPHVGMLRASLGVVFLLQLRWVQKMVIEFSYHLDSLVQLGFISMGFYLVQKRRFTLFSLAVAVGVTCRESSGFLLALAFPALGWRLHKMLAVSALPVAVFLLTRQIIDCDGYFSTYVTASVDLVLPYAQTIGYGYGIWISFGVLWLFALIGADWHEIKKQWLYIVLVCLQIVFATDTGRLLLLLYPMVILYSLNFGRLAAKLSLNETVRHYDRHN